MNTKVTIYMRRHSIVVTVAVSSSLLHFFLSRAPHFLRVLTVLAIPPFFFLSRVYDGGAAARSVDILYQCKQKMVEFTRGRSVLK